MAWTGLLRVARAIELRGPVSSELRARVVLPDETRGFAPVRLESVVRGRAAAILALAELGVEPGRLAIGARGAPAWPPGVVGSITHDDDVAAAAVARDRELRGVGIDTQRVTEEPPDTIALVATDEELTRIAPCPPRARFTVAFSAKESLYKCLAPTVGAFFGFEDARVVEASAEHVRLRLERTLHAALPAGEVFDVRWALDDARVRSALEW